MAKPFDPRKVLKQIANPLLREFFARRNELLDVPWGDLPEHRVEPVIEAWQALPEKQQLEVQVILRDISELADHRGIAVLSQEILQRRPDLGEEFKAQKGKQDMAMWVYLHLPEAFNEAALFARADALATGRHWRRRNSLPKRTIEVTDSTLRALGDGLTSFYGPLQMRGRCCKVVHYRRLGGAEYFFAYLDDYPDKQIVFDEDTDQPVVRSDRFAFQNVFVFNGDDGSMELFAQGGKKTWEPLQSVFCRAVLGEEIAPAAPLLPIYTLDHLIDPGLRLSTAAGDQIEEARITRMRIAPRGSAGYVEVKADPRNGPDDIHRKIDRWLRLENIAPGGARVLSVSFSLRFVHDGPGRQPTLSFDVSAPNSSNLKSKPDEYRAIGERCLKRWGVTNDE